MLGKGLKLSVALSLVLLAAACGSGDKKVATPVNTPAVQKTPEVTKEPVELTFYYMYADSNTEEFMKEHGNLIQKKYPNFSFKFIQNTKGTTIPEMVATKTDVDVFITINPSFVTLKDAGLDGDISDLVKKYNFDLNRFDPSVIDGLRKIGEGKLPGLPFKTNTLGLFYNKDIFDKFGVAYPKDGMTWDEILELSKKLTREDGAVQYRGFGIRPMGQMMQLNQYSLPVVDPKTLKAPINNDAWVKYLNTFVPFFQQSGYGATSALIQDAKQSDLFSKDKTTAMLVQMNSDYPKAFQQLGLNWDAVTFPAFKDKPGVGPQPDVVYYALSSTSKHRDEAFLAMAEITSDEVQMQRSKLGNPSVLKSKEIRDAFGTENTDLKGKNMKGLVPEKYAEAPQYTKYNTKSVGPLSTALRNIILAQKDTNTALREAEEKANKDIEVMAGPAK